MKGDGNVPALLRLFWPQSAKSIQERNPSARFSSVLYCAAAAVVFVRQLRGPHFRRGRDATKDRAWRCANIQVIVMIPAVIERDLAVPMRDGVRLFANLYRPTAGGPYPVIMSVTPYGKDKLPDRVSNFFMRLSGVKFGKINCSNLTGFESPDPVYWVQQGYAVLQADVGGMLQRLIRPQ